MLPVRSESLDAQDAGVMKVLNLCPVHRMMNGLVSLILPWADRYFIREHGRKIAADQAGVICTRNLLAITQRS